MSSMDTLADRDAALIHLRIRIHCGHARHREDVGKGEVQSIGFSSLPQMRRRRSLNVEIRNLQAV